MTLEMELGMGQPPYRRIRQRTRFKSVQRRRNAMDLVSPTFSTTGTTCGGEVDVMEALGPPVRRTSSLPDNMYQIGREVGHHHDELTLTRHSIAADGFIEKQPPITRSNRRPRLEESFPWSRSRTSLDTKNTDSNSENENENDTVNNNNQPKNKFQTLISHGLFSLGGSSRSGLSTRRGGGGGRRSSLRNLFMNDDEKKQEEDEDEEQQDAEEAARIREQFYGTYQSKEDSNIHNFVR